MRTDGTMKVTVFESEIEVGGEMLACARILGEAAEWLRNEAVKKVNVSAKKMEYHRLSDLQISLVRKAILTGPGPDYEGEILQLYVHYDDNEKG